MSDVPPTCAEMQEDRIAELGRKLSRAKTDNDDLLAACERMVGACTRFLEGQLPSDAQLADANWVSPLEQARATIAKPRGQA